MVGNAVAQILQRVHKHVVLSAMYLKMQVRTLACTGVSAESDELIGCHGHLSGTEHYLARIVVLLLLHPSHPGAYARREVAQVSVDTCQPVGVTHIDSFAKTVHAHRHLIYISLCHGVDWFALHVLGLYVDAAVEMVWPELAEVSGKSHLVVYGRQ